MTIQLSQQYQSSFASISTEQKDYIYSLLDIQENIMLTPEARVLVKEEESEIIFQNIKYMIAGLLTPTEMLSNIVDETISSEEDVVQFTFYALSDVPESVTRALKNNPKLTPADIDLLNSFHTPVSQTEVLPNTPTYDQNPTKDDILAGIENPTETVKTPSFALPKTKPQTAQILSGLAKSNTTIQTPEIVTELTPDTIIDPFLSNIGNAPKHLSTNPTVDILSNASDNMNTIIDPIQVVGGVPNNPATPAQKIIQAMDNKLNSVQSTIPTETFKSAPVPRHDPYREIPGL